LGHGTIMSWPHKPSKCALILMGIHVCSTSQELHFYLFVPSAYGCHSSWHNPMHYFVGDPSSLHVENRNIYMKPSKNPNFFQWSHRNFYFEFTNTQKNGPKI
jgi:hypothetical protein